MKGSLEDPTWEWAFRVILIAAMLWLFAGLMFGCQKVNEHFGEIGPLAVLKEKMEGDGLQVLTAGPGLVYVLDRKRELCFAAVSPYRVLTPLAGRECYNLLVRSAREGLQ